ncbi:hypothetical protein SFUMM280S_08851 [Streptomyces fumanus]
MAHGLTPYELAAHARAGQGPAPGTQQGTPPPARLSHPEATETVRLTDTDTDTDTDADAPPSRPLREVLADRRCVRDFAPVPLPLDRLGVLLARAARVRGRIGPHRLQQTRRPSPSGGGRHSIEVYVVAREVSGLAPGAYHYDPFDHALHRLPPPRPVRQRPGRTPRRGPADTPVQPLHRPGRDDWRITVKRVRGGAGPDGEVSSYLHANARVGNVLAICPRPSATWSWRRATARCCWPPPASASPPCCRCWTTSPAPATAAQPGTPWTRRGRGRGRRGGGARRPLHHPAARLRAPPRGTGRPGADGRARRGRPPPPPARRPTLAASAANLLLRSRPEEAARSCSNWAARCARRTAPWTPPS